MGFAKKVMESGEGLSAFMVIGFLGIVWLMIWGNLQGNLGFSQTSTSFVNETIVFNVSGNDPSSTSSLVDVTLTNVVITNATGGETLNSNNYTVTGSTVFASAVSEYNNSNVNVSYTANHDKQVEIDTNAVITNLTEGERTFFSFSNTIFTIMAIVLLITILLALLYIVLKIAQTRKGKGEGFSGY